MPFNIDTFRAQGLRYGGARPTQFEVFITTPQGLSRNAERKMRFSVMAASLPSFIVEPVVVPYFGRQIKFSGDRVFQDWQVTVMNDEDFTVRNAFEAWSNVMNTLVSNRLDPEFDSTGYKSEAIVRQYGKSGDVVRGYQFSGIFPSQVDNIGLQWDAVNQIESFAVNFSYDYFIMLPDLVSEKLEDNIYSPYLEDDDNDPGTTF